MTHRVRFNPHMHTSQTFRAMVDALDADPAELPTSTIPAEADDGSPHAFRPTSDEVDRARRIVAEAAGSDDVGLLVLLNPNCGDLIPLRAWPRERYVELARKLLARRPDVRIGLTGAPAEARDAEALVADIGSDRCFSLAGRTTLRELLVIYGLSEVLVTNDSGPAHFATLTPIDVVTLFGPEHPALFGARTPRNHVVWAGLACSPCVSAFNNRKSRCRNNLCLQSITADAVLALVDHVLDQRLRPEADAADRPLEIVLPQLNKRTQIS